jgi:DNA-binding response OmpR family regulator
MANQMGGEASMSEAIGRLEDVKVLIVDDDKDILESMDVAFQSEGALTQVSTDGNEAVRICRDEPPDLVILDMMLPKRSGFLVLERIKGYEDSPLVIMVTANEGKRHQAYAESLGVDGYLLKPVPLARLLAAAVELVEKKRATDGGLATERRGAAPNDLAGDDADFEGAEGDDDGDEE